jgi:Ca2+-binding RTX toxin-like protein
MPPINGDEFNNTLVGTEGADDIFGFGGNDSLSGLGGADRIDGGTGADTMAGGLGDDRYIVDDAGDVVTEEANQGNSDAVHTTLATYTLSANVEQLRFTGTTGTFAGTGNDLNNDIEGGAGNDSLIGLAGFDRLYGGTGNDTLVGGTDGDYYYVDSADDVVVEALNEGSFDTVFATSASYTLGDNVEQLRFAGTSGAFFGTGNALDNYMVGGAGNDTLVGLGGNDYFESGAGADSMVGGADNDTYIVDDVGDVVVEAANEGDFDSVNTTLSSYTLGANVEALTSTGTEAFTGTGNELDNYINGGASNDTLFGLGGNDILQGRGGTNRLVGGSGNDAYEISSPDDIIVESVDDGTDTVTVFFYEPFNGTTFFLYFGRQCRVPLLYWQRELRRHGQFR